MDGQSTRHLRRSASRLLVTLLLLVAAAAGTMNDSTASAQSFTGVEHWGVVVAGNESSFTFREVYSAPPIVLVSAQIGGQTLLSSTIHSYDGGFNVFVTDHQGNAVPEAWVQWIAVESEPDIGIQAGYQLTGGGRIDFETPFDSTPIVVTNAWANDGPMVSWNVDVDSTGFNVYALDAAGIPIDGRFNMYWIAVTPSAENGFFGGAGMYNHGDSVVFSPASTGGPAYVLSAAGGLRAAAVDNRPDGFTLSLIDSTGAPTIGGDLQWLGYAGPPTTTDDGDGDDDSAGLARIVVTATWSRTPSMAMPDTVCFDVSTDPGGSLIIASTCGSGDPLTLVLGSETDLLETGVLYYVSERVPVGWEIADDNPIEVEIPQQTGVAIVFFHNVQSGGLVSVEQGQIVITTAFAEGSQTLPDSVCYLVSSQENGLNSLGQVCGSGNPFTVTLGPNEPDLETGVTYYVTQSEINGWAVVGENPIATVIRQFGSVGVAFVNVAQDGDQQTGTLVVHKVNEAGESLNGACWLVGALDSDIEYGTDIDLCDTDNDGSTILELPPGDYGVVESVAPVGYGVNHGQQIITIIAGKTTEATFVDALLPPDGEVDYVGGDFTAVFWSGSRTGEVITGHLSIDIADDGAINHGRLIFSDRTELGVTGSLNGSVMALVIEVPGGTAVIYAVGVTRGSVASAQGTAGGTFDGPAVESGGGWQLVKLQIETSCGAQPCGV